MGMGGGERQAGRPADRHPQNVFEIHRNTEALTPHLILSSYKVEPPLTVLLWHLPRDRPVNDELERGPGLLTVYHSSLECDTALLIRSPPKKDIFLH